MKPSSSWGYLHFRKPQKIQYTWGNLPKPLSVGKLGNSVPTCFIHQWPWYLNHKCWSFNHHFFILQPPFLTVEHLKPPCFHTSTSVFDGYPKKKNMGASTPPSSAAVPPRHSRARWPGRSSTFPLISRPKIRCVGMSRIQKMKVTIPLPRDHGGWIFRFTDQQIYRAGKSGMKFWGWKKRDLWPS